MEEEKSKRNYKAFIVPVVAVAVFALLIFGAGFAYFSARITVNNVTNISATLPASNTVFETFGSSCDFTVNASDMVQSANNTTAAKASSSCTLTVNLSGSKDVTCTYKVKLDKISNTATTNFIPIYNISGEQNDGKVHQTSGLGTNKEFTAQLTLPAAAGGSSATAVNSSTTENQIDTLDGLQIASGTIKVATAGTTVSQVYTLTEKWYNLPLPQDGHESSTYKYKMSVYDVVC